MLRAHLIDHEQCDGQYGVYGAGEKSVNHAKNCGDRRRQHAKGEVLSQAVFPVDVRNLIRVHAIDCYRINGVVHSHGKRQYAGSFVVARNAHDSYGEQPLKAKVNKRTG